MTYRLQMKYGSPFPIMAPDAGGSPSADAGGQGGDGGKAVDGTDPTKTADAGGQDGGAAGGDGGGDGKQPEPPSKPDWMPDKLWGDGSQFQTQNGTLDQEAMAKTLSDSYTQAERKIFTRKDDLKKEVAEEVEAERRKDVPESPDKYAINSPDIEMPDGEKLELDADNPNFVQLKQWAHDQGLSQKQLDSLVSMYANAEVAKFPDFDSEAGKLGDNGKERIERASTWAQKHLSEDAYKTIESYAVSANFVAAFEELMELAGEPRFAMNGDGQVQSEVSRSELQKLMATPEYQQGDPATVQKVRAGFRKVAGQK